MNLSRSVGTNGDSCSLPGRVQRIYLCNYAKDSVPRRERKGKSFRENVCTERDAVKNSENGSELL